MAIVARDVAGNTATYNLAFTLDSTPPDAPAITGETVHTGIIRPRPFENGSRSTAVTLTGTRAEKTSVWINRTMKVALGTAVWSSNLALAQGANSLEIWLQDGAGNRSASTWVDIKVDSVAPAVTAIFPADNVFLKSPPQSITLTYEEATSGLNSAKTVFSVKDVNNQAMAGVWSLSGDGRLVSMRVDGKPVENINDLAGLARSDDAMAFYLSMLMFSLAGVPPLAGFFAKFYVFNAAVQAHLVPLAVIGFLTSVVAAYYYLRVVKIIYFDEPTAVFDKAPRVLHVVLASAGLFVLFLWVYPSPFVAATAAAAKSLF